jgi:hypothetical protein
MVRSRERSWLARARSPSSSASSTNFWKAPADSRKLVGSSSEDRIAATISSTSFRSGRASSTWIAALRSLDSVSLSANWTPSDSSHEDWIGALGFQSSERSGAASPDAEGGGSSSTVVAEGHGMPPSMAPSSGS